MPQRWGRERGTQQAVLTHWGCPVPKAPPSAWEMGIKKCPPHQPPRVPEGLVRRQRGGGKWACFLPGEGTGEAGSAASGSAVLNFRALGCRGCPPLSGPGPG